MSEVVMTRTAEDFITPLTLYELLRKNVHYFYGDLQELVRLRLQWQLCIAYLNHT